MSRERPKRKAALRASWATDAVQVNDGLLDGDEEGLYEDEQEWFSE